VSGPSVQYRVVVAKKDERIAGPDDAAVVITVPLAAASDDSFDPAVAYMQGVLKAAGHTGEIIDLLTDGAAATAIAELVSSA
jgi:hypothetical protein